jgi:hypothetical protein
MLEDMWMYHHIFVFGSTRKPRDGERVEGRIFLKVVCWTDLLGTVPSPFESPFLVSRVVRVFVDHCR